MVNIPQSTIFQTHSGLIEEIGDQIKKVIPNTENNPDLLIVKIESTQSIGIKQIKELIHWAQLRPFQEKYKLAVIEQAEKLTTEAQNSLLKTLEEPPKSAYIFLVTPNPKSLLPTIRSRTAIYKIESTNEFSQEVFDMPKDIKSQIELINKITKTNDPKAKKNNIQKLLLALHQEAKSQNNHYNLHLIEQTQRALKRNCNIKLIAENLIFNYQNQ